MEQPTPEERIERQRLRRLAAEQRVSARPILPINRKSTLFAIAVIIAVILLGSGISQYRKISRENKLQKMLSINSREIKILGDMVEKLQELEEVASVTSRIALAVPVTNMQSAKRELESLELGDCFTESKQKALKGISSIISGYITFMGSRYSESVAVLEITGGETMLEQAKNDSFQCSDAKYIESKYFDIQ